jgi:hypothetical protein
MALEFEAVPEYEDELEWEGELESEEFFRQLAGLAQQAVRSPTLRRAAQVAARSATRSAAGRLAGVGPGLGGPARPAATRASAAGGAGLGRILADLLRTQGGPQRELELEWEAEANPIRRVYPDALMEHLGHRAAETPSEAEAEALMSALVPLAARLVPRAAGAIMRASPQLARGVAGITRALRADPAMRPLLRTLPGVVNATARSIARQSASGQPVTPRRAVSTLAGQTARTLASPQRSVAAWQRSRALDRSYHRHVRPGGPLVPAGF